MSMASSSTRRIFPITDWAPAHEALYPDADNDSSIDTLPLSTKDIDKPGESSASSSVATPIRRANTKKYRSMSLPWRPKSVLQVDELDSRHRNLSLQRSHAGADFVAVASPSASPSASPQVGFGNWSGFAPGSGFVDVGANAGADTAGFNSKGKGKKSISGMWRRASVQIKGLVNRRTSIATEILQEKERGLGIGMGMGMEQEGRASDGDDSKRQLRSNHVPSRSHHLFNTGTQHALTLASPLDSASASASASVSSRTPAFSPPTSPRSGPQHQYQHPQLATRPSTSHAINATWHRLRKATSTSFRHSRILHGDFSLHEHGQAHEHQHPYAPPDDDLPHSVPRPGVGNEPPVIPRNTGSGARAAVAAWQHEMFPTVHPLKNKRLTLDSAQNDRESGIGIAITASDSVADDLQDLDMVSADGETLLGGCAPSRVDFIDRLPVELAIQVLAHLDAAGLATSSRVSRSWYEIASLQHIWRESYLREKTGTFATSEPIMPGAGLGVPALQPSINWKHAYRATEDLAKRWKKGKAASIYLNGHSDSIYCLQFDE